MQLLLGACAVLVLVIIFWFLFLYSWSNITVKIVVQTLVNLHVFHNLIILFNHNFPIPNVSSKSLYCSWIFKITYKRTRLIGQINEKFEISLIFYMKLQKIYVLKLTWMTFSGEKSWLVFGIKGYESKFFLFRFFCMKL